MQENIIVVTVSIIAGFYQCIDFLKNLFSISFRGQEDEQRPLQEQAYIFFSDFLDDCEGLDQSACNYYMVCSVFDIVAAGDSVCALEDVLIFCTGAASVPPAGFHMLLKLVFLGANENLPTASTCSLILRIPSCHASYDAFKDMMELGMKGNDGFGGV